MIQIAGSQLCQWDVGRSVNISDSKATHVHFANQGDSKAVIIEITNGTAKIPDYLLQTGKALNAYAVLDGVTLESRSFAVCKRERPENYVYDDDRRNYIYELITRAEDAVENANQAAQKANEAAEKLGSIVIPTKVSQLENDSGFLTEAPVTTTKVELTKQTDGSYLSDLSSTEIMAAYRDHKTVHCYHNKMILPLIRSVVNDAVFSGIYDGQIHTVNVASNRVATVTVIPLSSGGGSGEPGKDGADGITPHIGANGNWFIGEEDTGVSAGVTDEQISDAVEAYMEDNPLVKTVNGTAPDENGNVELELPSGGGGGGYARNKLVYSLTLTEQVSSIAISFTPEQRAILENANGYAIALNLLSGEGVVAEDKNPGNVDIRPGYRHDAIQLAGAVPTDKTNATEITSVGYVDRRLANVLPNGGSVLVRTVVRAKVSPTYTHPNTRCTTYFENEFTITLDYPVGIGSSVNVYAIDVSGV